MDIKDERDCGSVQFDIDNVGVNSVNDSTACDIGNLVGSTTSLNVADPSSMRDLGDIEDEGGINDPDHLLDEGVAYDESSMDVEMVTEDKNKDQSELRMEHPPEPIQSACPDEIPSVSTIHSYCTDGNTDVENDLTSKTQVTEVVDGTPHKELPRDVTKLHENATSVELPVSITSSHIHSGNIRPPSDMSCSDLTPGCTVQQQTTQDEEPRLDGNQRDKLPCCHGLETCTHVTPNLKYGTNPFSRVYSPLSATPDGFRSTFKTPNQPPRHNLHPSTPGKNKVTPDSQIHQLFDSHFLDRIHTPVFSPSVFKKASTPRTDECKAFHWSIEDKALLNPVDIDVTTYQSPFTLFQKDKDTEELMQKAIRTYFTSNIIVPSPYGPHLPHRLPLTPAEQGSNLQQTISYDPQKDQVKKMQDSCCQTILTLPLTLDLNEYLGEFMTYKPEEEEILSTSTLRRKLFFQGDTSSIPSPSPVKATPEPDCTNGFQASPLSDNFSSSPKVGNLSRRGRSSIDRDLASPDLSPVKFVEGSGSFLSSPCTMAKHAAQRFYHYSQHSPVSPVHHDASAYNPPLFNSSPTQRHCNVTSNNLSMSFSPQATAATARRPPDGRCSQVEVDPANVSLPFCPSANFDSVFSPQTKRSPIHETRLHSPGSARFDSRVSPSSFVSEIPSLGNRGDLLLTYGQLSATRTPMRDISPYIQFSPGGVSTPERPEDYSGRISSSSTPAPAQQTSCHSNDRPLYVHTDVYKGRLCENPIYGNVTTYDTTANIDLSFPADTFCDQDVCGQSDNQVSQDTGYQTSSLHSTNIHQSSTAIQDVSQHTNLTAQFMQLPFRGSSDNESRMEMTETPKAMEFDRRRSLSQDSICYSNAKVPRRDPITSKEDHLSDSLRVEYGDVVQRSVSDPVVGSQHVPNKPTSTLISSTRFSNGDYSPSSVYREPFGSFIPSSTSPTSNPPYFNEMTPVTSRWCYPTNYPHIAKHLPNTHTLTDSRTFQSSLPLTVELLNRPKRIDHKSFFTEHENTVLNQAYSIFAKVRRTKSASRFDQSPINNDMSQKSQDDPYVAVPDPSVAVPNLPEAVPITNDARKAFSGTHQATELIFQANKDLTILDMALASKQTAV